MPEQQLEVAVTGAEAGLTGDAQIKLALEAMVSNGGTATMQQIYDKVQSCLDGRILSEQGRATLRTFVNRDAVAAGFVYKYDKNNPGWRITPEGRDFLGQPAGPGIEQVINIDTQAIENKLSNAVRGAAFERYVLRLMKAIYPFYTWYHQGQHKALERGLDFIGTRISDRTGDPPVLGVQAKFHAPNNALTQVEWLKFLAGCFARRVDTAILITTGRLTQEQRREAGEAMVIVIEGQDEVERVAAMYGIDKFELFEDTEAQGGGGDEN